MPAQASAFLDITASLSNSAFSTGPICELQTGPTDYHCITEIIVSLPFNNNGAAALTLGVGRPAALGTGVNGQPFVLEGQDITNSSSGSKLYKSWTTKPTVPTNFMRRLSVNLGQGAGSQAATCDLVFRFARNLILLPSSSIVLWLVSVNSGSLLSMDAAFAGDV